MRIERIISGKVISLEGKSRRVLSCRCSHHLRWGSDADGTGDGGPHWC